MLKSFPSARAGGATALALLAALAARGADALPALGCYARAYDKAHLSAHKNQIVDKAWLSIETRKDTPPYPFLATLQFSVTGGGRSTFSTFGACKENDGGLSCNASLSAEEADLCKKKGDGVRSCRIDYEHSGSFRIATQPEGVLVTVAERLELIGRDKYLYLSPDNRENHAFLLKPAPEAACK